MKNNKIEMRKLHIQKLLEKEGPDNRSKWTFETLCQKGLIEFLDVEEEETAMIAMHLSDLYSEKAKEITFTH